MLLSFNLTVYASTIGRVEMFVPFFLGEGKEQHKHVQVHVP